MIRSNSHSESESRTSHTHDSQRGTKPRILSLLLLVHAVCLDALHRKNYFFSQKMELPRTDPFLVNAMV